jgi:hypothetical protein
MTLTASCGGAAAGSVLATTTSSRRTCSKIRTSNHELVVRLVLWAEATKPVEGSNWPHSSVTGLSERLSVPAHPLFTLRFFFRIYLNTTRGGTPASSPLDSPDPPTTLSVATLDSLSLRRQVRPLLQQPAPTPSCPSPSPPHSLTPYSSPKRSTSR